MSVFLIKCLAYVYFFVFSKYLMHPILLLLDNCEYLLSRNPHISLFFSNKLLLSLYFMNYFISLSFCNFYFITTAAGGNQMGQGPFKRQGSYSTKIRSAGHFGIQASTAMRTSWAVSSSQSRSASPSPSSSQATSRKVLFICLVAILIRNFR